MISKAEISHKLWFYELIAVVCGEQQQQQTRNEERVDDGTKKRSAVHFTPRKIAPKLPSAFLIYMGNAKHFSPTGFCFERLSDGWFWFIVANYLTSFLSRSAEKSCTFIKRGRVSLFLILTDCHLMLVFLSHPVQLLCVPVQCFYITKDTLFSRFLTADCLFVCTFSIYFDWTRIDERGSRRKAINIHVKCALKSSRQKP